MSINSCASRFVALNRSNLRCFATSTVPLIVPSRLESSGLASTFVPASVAIVGATEREGSVGRTIVNNLIKSKEQSLAPYSIYPVNPTRDTVLGIPCFKSLDSIPGNVDMVVFVTPAKSCVEVMRQCADKNVKAAVVISAGFKEAGPEGIRLENELIGIARQAGIRVIGPNCIGVMNPNYGLNATFASTMGQPGNLAFISQSGAMCTAVLDSSLRDNVGFSAFVSIGSMADVNWGDLLDYLGDDPKTDAILIYMESIGDAASFLGAAKEVGRKKPIIVIKAGKTEAAASAAASHTGSLAGSYDSFEAAMQRVGVLTVDTIQELTNCALFLGKQPRPLGPNLVIVTNAGGPAVLATDATVSSGAEIAQLDKSTIDEISTFCPAAWSHSNPVDILGDAPAKLYAQTLEAIMKDKNADGVLIVLSPQDVTNPTETAHAVIRAAEKARTEAAARHEAAKPVFCAWMGGESVAEGFKLLNSSGIPTFANPDDAADVFGRLWTQVAAQRDLYAPNPQQVPSKVDSLEPIQRRIVCGKILEDAIGSKRYLLTEAESKLILNAYGIETVKTIICETPEAAEEAAKSLGGKKFAVKLNSETLTHKADVGGVLLNLENAQQVREGFEKIRDTVTKSHGAVHFQGVTVQPMVQLDKGIELILGSTVDPQFGPMILFGNGGTMVEIYKDTSLGIPPIHTNLAKQMIGRTRIAKALRGGHGKRFEGVDMALLEANLLRFSEMILDLKDYVLECDINPLLAMKDSFIALDARFALKPKNQAATPIAMRPYPSEYSSFIDDFHIRPPTTLDYSSLESFLKQSADPKYSAVELAYSDFNRTIPFIGTKRGDDKIEAIAILNRAPPNHLSREIGYVELVTPSKEPLKTSNVCQNVLSSVVEAAGKEDIKELRFSPNVDTSDVASSVAKNWTVDNTNKYIWRKK